MIMRPETTLRSLAMRHYASPAYRHRQHQRARRRCKKQRAQPEVHYFHRVDDPHSHLAVQRLDVLRAAYTLDFRVHLVSKPPAPYLGNPESFDAWAVRDAQAIAPLYRVAFSPAIVTPTQKAVAAANAALAPMLDQDNFASEAGSIGERLWAGASLDAWSETLGTKQKILAGTALQQSLGHFLGGMFYFQGEWYWGIDRIRSLEARLHAEGYSGADWSPCVPEPKPDTSKQASNVLLEYFPSLRSPFTAIGHQRVLDLIQRTGIRVGLRPVMPMLMRGVTAPRAKQRFIITDAAQQGREQGAPLGRIVDPFGEPVRRAFDLYPGAVALGQEMAFITAYLQAAWQDGVDISSNRGLQQVADRAGIDWLALNAAAKGLDSAALLQSNLAAMQGGNLWGVPSFRISGGGKAPLCCWGQDRIWLVEHDIASRTP